jgi:hypothetical protein
VNWQREATRMMAAKKNVEGAANEMRNIIKKIKYKLSD